MSPELKKCICCVESKSYPQQSMPRLQELLDCFIRYGTCDCPEGSASPSGSIREYEFILDEAGQKIISLPGFAEILTSPEKYEVYIDGRKAYYSRNQFTYITGTFSVTAGELASGSFVSITIR